MLGPWAVQGARRAATRGGCAKPVSAAPAGVGWRDRLIRVPRVRLRKASRRERIAYGVVRGAVAAMAMTGFRQLTTGLGLVDQTPPDAILKQRAAGPLVANPRLAYIVARRETAIVELAHWLYGAGGGAAFALLPRDLLRSAWAGPAYGLATWVAFELSIAPLLGLDHARRVRPVERLMFAADHLLYGLTLAGTRGWALRGPGDVRRGGL